MKTSINWINKDFALDKSDERDYKYDDVFPEEIAGIILPKKKVIDLKTDYQNQALEEITKYMCVFYNTAHGTNILNDIEWSLKETIKWKELWLEAIDLWLLDPNAWTYIVSWPKLLKRKWLISWYVKVNWLQEIKQSIYNNRPISVWTNNINWKETKKVPYIAIWGQSYWHAFLIIWYDDEKELFYCKNSYWKETFDNWINYLKYSDLWLLFPSKYSLIDQEDPILAYKKQIIDNINLEEAKKMFQLWYWNGKDATKSMSREEVMTVLYRVMKKLWGV